MIVCCDRLLLDLFNTSSLHFQVDYPLNTKVSLFLLDFGVLPNSEIVFKQAYFKQWL